MIKKIIDRAGFADLLQDEMTIMIGGFLACGTPETLVEIIEKKGVKNLTIICNDTSFPDKGIGRLIAAKQVKRGITSHIGTIPETGKQMVAGTLKVDLVPQGTLIERIRAGGAGLGGILTPTGIGTTVEEGKQKITVNGKEYLLELPMRADLALIHGSIVDKSGNVIYKGTTKNFNPIIALAADNVVVEARELVEVGAFEPEQVMTPGPLVKHILPSGSN